VRTDGHSTLVEQGQQCEATGPFEPRYDLETLVDVPTVGASPVVEGWMCLRRIVPE
jgi:hypothetical protein